MSDDLLDLRAAERLTRAVQAAQTLSETLWEALHDELAARPEIGAHGRRVAELSERLGEVAGAITSLIGTDGRPAPSGSPVGDPVESGSRVARVTLQEPSSPPARSPQRESSAADEPLSAAVLVDELAPKARQQEIEIKDERRESHRERMSDESGPDAWVGAIERRLERYQQDGLGFAVLLVELVGVERLRHAELPGEVARLTGLVEAALAAELRPADSLTRESPGRYWLMAPETDAPGARLLAERLANAVRGAASHRGAPLEVAVGVAACPGDGRQAAALAAHADIGLYAARATGRPVASAEDPA